MTKRLRVRDLMSDEVLSLRPEEDLSTLYDLMESRHIRHIPVVDEDGTLLGLVTHRDLIRSALTGGGDLPLSTQRELLRSIRVKEIMTRDVETVEPDDDILEAAEVMLENKFGCLPVIESDRIVGILTEADFVRYLAEDASAARMGETVPRRDRPPRHLRS